MKKIWSDDPSLLYKVKKANQKFYNTISESYEIIDGKRDQTAIKWISKKLKRIQKISEGKILLDIGCGSGFILRNAQPYFRTVVGMDISFEILKKLRKEGNLVVCADVDHLPFKNESFCAISCFAVLHHLCMYSSLTSEAFRVLKKGGVFYSDHDLDKKFEKRFRVLMKLYRTFFNEEKKYLRANSQITSEMYHFTEIHHTGIKTGEIIELLKKQKFSYVAASYHWFGLFPLLTKFCLFFEIRSLKRGNAPLASLVAKK